MKKFDGVLFVSDIDGTLYGNDYKLSQENRKALEYFTNNGGKFALASGRSIADVEQIGKEICNTYYIGFNGSAIGRGGKLCYKIQFDSKVFDILQQISKDIEYTDIEFITDYGIFAYGANKYTEMHKSFVSDAVFESINSFDLAPRDAFMLAFWMPAEKIQDFAKYMQQAGYYDYCECFQGFKYSFECVPKGSGKGTAAVELKKMLGCHTLVTSGDNGNDLSMIQLADYSFAPANALEEIKNSATKLLVRNADQSIMPEIMENIEDYISTFTNQAP